MTIPVVPNFFAGVCTNEQHTLLLLLLLSSLHGGMAFIQATTWPSFISSLARKQAGRYINYPACACAGWVKQWTWCMNMLYHCKPILSHFSFRHQLNIVLYIQLTSCKGLHNFLSKVLLQNCYLWLHPLLTTTCTVLHLLSINS